MQMPQAQTQSLAQAQKPSFLSKSAGNVVTTPHVRAELMVYAPDGVQAGKPFWLGLQLQHQSGWHTYWKNPGDAGLPTQLTWTMPSGIDAGVIDWPTPKKIQVGDLTNYGYDNEVLLSVPVAVQNNFQAASGDVLIQLKAQWLVCKTECVPEEGLFSLKLPVHGSTALYRAQFDAARNNLAKPYSGEATSMVSANDKTLQLSLSALPSNWQGKVLEAFPEEAQLIGSALKLEQAWVKGQWIAKMPLSPDRTTSPAQMRWLVKIAGASNNPALAVHVPVSGSWPVIASSPAMPSPALEAALAQNKIDAAAHDAGSASWLSATFGIAILSALLGGLILNLMPCVLPVLAIKLLSFAPKKTNSGRASVAQVMIEPSTGTAVVHSDETLSFRSSSGLFAIGVIATFTALGAILLALRGAGQSLGWGFQLQSPNMVVALAVLFLQIGLNLFEVFELRIFLPQWAVNFQSSNPSIEALASGVLAVLIATPCTAPFMGASLGLAITLPTVQALLIFIALGVGMALPFIALAMFPRVGGWLLQVLPKPGDWMLTMRQLLAWPVFATVLWLLWIYAQQTSINHAFAVLSSLLMLVAVMWALGLPKGWMRYFLTVVFAACLVASYIWGRDMDASAKAETATQVANNEWNDWSAEKQQEARQQGRPVFVDFTAAWCLTCQVNKSSTLHRADMMALFKDKNVLLLRADWTKPNDKIAAELSKLGRTGLPVYAFYLPGSAVPQLLPEVLTTDTIKQVLSVL